MDKNVMPEPQTVNYSVYYAVTEKFVNDFLFCTSQMAYVDVMKVLNIVNKHGKIISVAQLNEIIRTVGTFPYKYVSGLMTNINNDAVFATYFLKQPEGFNPGF
jgi:hypothetical protein